MPGAELNVRFNGCPERMRVVNKPGWEILKATSDSVVVVHSDFEVQRQLAVTAK